MAPKEKKTATELAALIMREIRELPECDHIARVAITRAPRRASEQSNWRFSWALNGNWAVPESAFKIAERFQAQIDLAFESAPMPSAHVGAARA
jgi:hypothetical protein